jgi:cardiolipin synthase
VNLDMRSFWLNYEVALVINDRDFVAALRDLHESYLGQCDELDRVAWSSRGVGSRLVQNTLRLASPLL